MAPGWELRDKALAENRPASREACAAALRELESAPVEELIRTYVSRTGSRGEMGILTSINQRLMEQLPAAEKLPEGEQHTKITKRSNNYPP